MKAKSVAALLKTLPAVEAELTKLPSKIARQIRLIELINEYTGSTFTGFNLNDQLGRFAGCVLWPMPPERIKIITELGPTLSALLVASPLHQVVWDFGTNKAFAMPDALLHNTQAYHHAYKVAGMHHLGWYDYPQDADQNHVIVVISRSDRAFAPPEIRALQCICDRFGAVINSVDAGGPISSGHSRAEDHSLELDDELKPKSISAYAHALIALFYGPLRKQQTLLPECLVEDIETTRRECAMSVLPTSSGAHFAFTKRKQGRMLCVVVNAHAKAPLRLTIYEDLKHLDRLRRIKAACRKLRRDRYSTLAVCLALLDEVSDEATIRRQSGLASHKASSSRRLICKARHIIASN